METEKQKEIALRKEQCFRIEYEALHESYKKDLSFEEFCQHEQYMEKAYEDEEYD